MFVSSTCSELGMKILAAGFVLDEACKVSVASQSFLNL